MAQQADILAKKDYVDDNYQPKLVAGTGISINPSTNVISSSGGGSLVTYAGNPNISQGDSLGVLTINGTSNVIMSPGLIPGTNVTITTDISTGAKTIAATGGTTVTPNPQGTPSGVLTSIGIGNAIYSLQGGAYYGTTDPSSSLGIDGDIYIKYTSGTPDTIDAMFVKINDEWIEAELGGGGGASDLNDLTDVDITSPTNGQVLKYNSTTSKWENGTGGGGSTDAEEMTYAEYNALTPAEKTDGTIRFITDYPAGGSNIKTDLFENMDVLSISNRYATASLNTNGFSFNMREYDNTWSTNATIYNDTVIDLTDYDELEFDIGITAQADYGAFWLTLSKVKYTWGGNAFPTIYPNVDSLIKVTESGTYSVDISELNGNYYIYLGGTTGKPAIAHGGESNEYNGEIVGTLTSLYGVIHNGGSEGVVPNPQGEPTDTLNTIGIDGIIYDIAGSGGGGSFNVTDLFVNEQHSDLTQITLSESIENYDLIEFIVEDRTYQNYTSFVYDSEWMVNNVPYVSDNPTGTFSHIFLPGYDNHYMRATMGQTNDKLIIPTDKNSLMIYAVRGLKSGGSGGGGGGQIDVLYSAETATPPQTITLEKALTDYDYIITHIKSSVSGRATIGYIYTVESMATGDIIGGELAAGSGWIWYTYTSATLLTYLGVNNDYYITEITGLKIGGGGGGGNITVEYKDYANFIGQGRIILPFTVNSDYKITATFQAPTYKNDNSIFGNTSNSNLAHCTIYNSQYYVSTGNGETSFSKELYGKHTITMNDGGYTTFDGDNTTNFTPTTDNSVSLVLAGRNSDGQNYMGKIYKFIIESISTGTEIIHLKPAIIRANGIVIAKGLLDSVSGEIYTTTGMTLGND